MTLKRLTNIDSFTLTIFFSERKTALWEVLSKKFSYVNPNKKAFRASECHRDEKDGLYCSENAVSTTTLNLPIRSWPAFCNQLSCNMAIFFLLYRLVPKFYQWDEVNKQVKFASWHSKWIEIQKIRRQFSLPFLIEMK